MSQRKNYSRYFIILQEDEKGYGLSSDKMPTGYAKLEVKNGKCKVTFYVQNLKIEMRPYYIMLICNKKGEKKLIKLAELNIDNSGRTEICKEFESSNIAGSGIDVDKVSGATVVRSVSGNMISVLTGFTSTDIPKDWKKYTLMDMTEKKDDEKKHIDDNVEDFDKYEAEIETVREHEKSAQIKRDEKTKQQDNDRASKKRDNHNKSKENTTAKKPIIKDEVKEDRKKDIRKDKKKVIQEEIRDDMQEEVEEEVKEEIQEEIRDDRQEEVKEEVKEEVQEEGHEEIEKNENFNGKAKIEQREEIYGEEKIPKYNNFINKRPKDNVEFNKSEKFFNRIIEDLEPFGDDFEEIGKSKWFTVPVNSIEDMYRASSYNKYAIIYYPMINYFPYIIKHGHYIIGYKFDDMNRVKYVMYGIPGTRETEDQPFDGKYGFVSFVRGNEERGDDVGYWLLFYDFRRAVVVIPTQK